MRLWILVFALCLVGGYGLGFTDTLRDSFLRLHHQLTHFSLHNIQKRQALDAFDEDDVTARPPEVVSAYQDQKDVNITADPKDTNDTLVEVKPKRTKRVGKAYMDFKACGEEDDMLYVSSLTMSPSPIVVPGPLTLKFNLDAHGNTSAPIGAQLFMKKKLAFLFGLTSWFDIPCLEYPDGKVGSCEYEDVCPLEFFSQAVCRDSNDINTCGCPVMEGNYISRPVTFDIPEIPENVPAYLLDGEFEIKGILKKNEKTITCYSLNVDFKSEILEIDDDEETEKSISLIPQHRKLS